ncbi:hypothetical protein [Bacillus wiedmannii]|uniref:hypothetical protein n=1 Tax=Bacillus wiedmannii TaxID=1890302 RepID=UPI0012450CE2|nr:hypothetical protein [Bacillus wiedmannii]
MIYFIVLCLLIWNSVLTIIILNKYRKHISHLYDAVTEEVEVTTNISSRVAVLEEKSNVMATKADIDGLLVVVSKMNINK